MAARTGFSWRRPFSGWCAGRRCGAAGNDCSLSHARPDRGRRRRDAHAKLAAASYILRRHAQILSVCRRTHCPRHRRRRRTLPEVAAAQSPTLNRIKATGTITFGYRDNAVPFSVQGSRRPDQGLIASSSAARVAGAIQNELALTELKIEWLPVEAVEPPRLRDQRQGRRRLRDDDDHARADAEGRFQPCRSTSTAAACSVRARSKLARLTGAQGQAHCGDRGHHDHRKELAPRPRHRGRARSARAGRDRRRGNGDAQQGHRWTATRRTASCSPTSSSARRIPMPTLLSPAIFRTSRSGFRCAATIRTSSWP